MNRHVQTNTFHGGMNMDIDYSLMKDNQYIYAENLRVVANNEGTFGVAQTIEGFDKATLSTNFASNETIIHTDVIRDYGVVFTKQGDVNNIYRFDFTKSDLAPTVKKVISAKLDIQEPVSSVCRWESSDNIKVYWADGEHQIRVANIAPSMDEYNSTITPDILDILPNNYLPAPYFVKYGGGSLESGKIQYCYQLFNVRGTETSVSPLSGMIRLSRRDINNPEVIGTAENENSSKSVIIKADLNDNSFTHARIISLHYRGNNVMPNIKVIDEVAIVGNTLYYEDNGTNFINELTIDEFNALITYLFTPEVLETKDNILFAANITEDTWDIEYDARAYRGNRDGDVLLKSSTGNDLNFNLRNLTAATVPSNHDAINPYNIDDTLTYKYGIKETGATVLGGTGLNVSYRFIKTDLVEDDSTSDAGLLEPTRSLRSAIATVDSLKLSYVDSTSDQIDNLQLPESRAYALSYGDPVIDNMIKSYHRDEVYRFGLVFYNEKNVASAVHWIADIKMPTSSESSIFNSNVSVTLTNGQILNNRALVTHPLGIRFDVRNIPTGVTGFEIVRCDRTLADRSIVAQGAVSRVGMAAEVWSYAQILRPYQFLTYTTPSRGGYFTADSINDIESTDTHYFDKLLATFTPPRSTSDNVFLFVSPEVGVNREAIENATSGVNGVQEVYRLFSRIQSNTSELRGFINLSSDPYNALDGAIKTRTKADGEKAQLIALISNSDNDDYNNTSTSETLAKYYSNIIPTDKHKAQIDSLTYAAALDWNNYDADNLVTGAITIGNNLFANTIGSLYGGGNTSSSYSKGHKQALGGPSLLFVSDDMLTNIIPNDVLPLINPSYLNYSISSVVLCNLKKESAMYGGTTFSSRQNSTYIGFGAYKKAESGSNAINCFGGDTYIGVFDYAVATRYFKEDSYNSEINMKHVHSAYIPCETSINMLMRNDTVRMSRQYNINMQNNISVIGNIYAQNKPMYAYYDAYSANPKLKIFVEKGLYNIDNLESDARIIHSQPKTDNEVSDSWTKFRVGNYLDVDNQYGSVNNLVNFKNNLFFFQTDAFGTLAVNERSLISDNNPGALVLGTGDILARYDYLSIKNGSKAKYLRNVTQSDSTLYWYDADRAEVCGFNGDLQTVSKLKGVQSYLNGGKHEFNVNPNMVYDKKYNDVLLTLDNKTLTFNEQLGAFTSFYTVEPDWYFEFTDKLYTFKDKDLFLYNAGTLKNLYTGQDKVTKLQFVVNKDYPQTKTFDNVQYGADVTWGTNMDDIVFETKRQTSFVTKYNQIDYREDTYKFAIPRSDRELNEIEELVNKSYRDRMKGKYMICTYHYDNNDQKQFKLPYISTYYRYSMI